MNDPALIVLIVGVPLAVLAARVSVYFEDHPHPIREWRLWHGLLEMCPRCRAEVPAGWIDYQRTHYTTYFGVPFDRQLDGHYIMRGWGMWMGGGRHCSICDTLYPENGGPPIRPKFFRYGQNKDFGIKGSTHESVVS